MPYDARHTILNQHQTDILALYCHSRNFPLLITLGGSSLAISGDAHMLPYGTLSQPFFRLRSPWRLLRI